MNHLSTYIETPEQFVLLEKFHFETIIVDLPFCSIRSHCNYDWTNEELIHLKTLHLTHLCLNLDGIYSDDELTIIESTIKHRQLDTIFSAFRIQDPGLLLWVKERFKAIDVQLNSETGFQNFPAIDALFDQGLSSFTLNHETPYPVIKDFQSQQTRGAFELMVQGPILIQYSRRRFLSDRYDKDPSQPIRVDAEDPELPKRQFTFLNTVFGHFMFAQFQRCLANQANKLKQLPNISWLIDARGESIQYFTTALFLYQQLYQYDDTTLSIYIKTLQEESKKPQKPGFFLANNTDYDWRDHSKRKPSIGKIVSVKKEDAILVQFYQNVLLPREFACINPDNTTVTLTISELKNLDLSATHQINEFTPYIISPPVKGIQINGELYFKDS